jgi:hypothetical protein
MKEANKMRPTARPLVALFARRADLYSDPSVICRSLLCLLLRAASDRAVCCIDHTVASGPVAVITRFG